MWYFSPALIDFFADFLKKDMFYFRTDLDLQKNSEASTQSSHKPHTDFPYY